MPIQENLANRHPPRLFGIVAAQTDLVAVIRRGPSNWCQMGKWHIAERRYEAGSWFKGKIFPQRCDVSPDGRWLCYMAYQGGARWALGDAYVAISRCPWLSVLAAWGLGSTYPRGFYFVNDPDLDTVGVPDIGHLEISQAGLGLAVCRPMQFAVERRRGWIETSDCDPRHANDHWDVRRHVRLQKDQPHYTDPFTLTVEGKYAGFREMSSQYWAPSDLMYTLKKRDEVDILDDVQWADWSHHGELLVATTSGKLEIRRLTTLQEYVVLFEEDLSDLKPNPCEAPAWAQVW